MITFKLMKRLRGSLIAYPAGEVIREENETVFNMSEKEATNIHCKLLLADKDEVLTIIDRERRELLTSMTEDENFSEGCFIQEALTLLQIRETAVFNQLGSEIQNVKCNVLDLVSKPQSSDISKDKLENDICERINSKSLDCGNYIVEHENITVEDLDISQSKIQNYRDVHKYFYFYQGKIFEELKKVLVIISLIKLIKKYFYIKAGFRDWHCQTLIR